MRPIGMLGRDNAPNEGRGDSQMQEPGLDNRHRDKDGEISRKHGNTLVRTLRRIYGHNFASGFPEVATLADVLRTAPAHSSLHQLRNDHDSGLLEGKIRQHS